MNIIIRTERSDDVTSIGSVTKQAFAHAEHSNHCEHFVVGALREAGVLILSLVAEFEGKIIGHVAVSPVEISNGSSNWFGLGPVSVLPKYQGQGIGSKLINQALLNLRSSNAEGCVVLGDPDYYGRFGFKAEPSMVLEGVPAEYFQSQSFGCDMPKGNVTYHEGFYCTS
ncbi:GNAT family N-acetyltransferase [Pseudoalteromonas luteoviolacea]|uniref:GNAT family N-acetyltransferase n=1 Tax=Pseudoalteromonas luteoviolacea TaxID=43657 RepID=UPI0011512032|nr:N-acetyltransferase [Pseudoalteromonas luteoviolacea]TQF71143.1 N-acetyltransferase [Pseudoalteromonas luteoviolacea]